MFRFRHDLSDGTVTYSTGTNRTRARAGIWNRLPAGVRVERSIVLGEATR